MPPKGINGRANMQKFQMNSKKYGGNPFKYTSLVSSVGRASKGGMWNYIQRRADHYDAAKKTSSQSCSGSAPVQVTGSTSPAVLHEGVFAPIEVTIEFDKPLNAFAGTEITVRAQFILKDETGALIGNPTEYSTDGEGKLILNFNAWEFNWPPTKLTVTYTNSGLNTLKRKNCPSVIVNDFVDFEVYSQI